jgi:hypothetical protein
MNELIQELAKALSLPKYTQEATILITPDEVTLTTKGLIMDGNQTEKLMMIIECFNLEKKAELRLPILKWDLVKFCQTGNGYRE